MIRPTINGLAYDFTCLDFGLLGGVLTPFLMDISFRDEVVPGVLKGVHGIDLATTRGTYKADFSITMYAEGFTQFLLPALGEGASSLIFPITSTFYNLGTAPYEVYCDSCRMLNPDESYRNGDTNGLPVRIKFYTKFIARNGICIYNRA